MYNEYEEFSVLLPVGKTFEIVKKMINENTQIIISLFGIEIEDDKIYGRIYDNMIEYYNRPKYTQGIRYKTILTFQYYENNLCKIIIERKKIKFYALLWIIMTLLSFIIFSIIIYNTNSYIVTNNNISEIVNDHPYFLWIFPTIISIMFLINIKMMSSQRIKSMDILKRIKSLLKEEEEIKKEE
jgi:ABC-type multidrug transport system fused ATPase/permease subunit